MLKFAEHILESKAGDFKPALADIEGAGCPHGIAAAIAYIRLADADVAAG